MKNLILSRTEWKEHKIKEKNVHTWNLKSPIGFSAYGIPSNEAYGRPFKDSDQ